jgi:hypothetical protein
MKHIKRYSELFESEGKLTKRQIEFLNKYTLGKWGVNPSTGLVDVDGDFSCFRKGLSTLRGIRFGKITGGFYCDSNKLTSLVGAPKEVDWDFYCSNNRLTLTSLKGAPERVGGDFRCEHNDLLTSLIGAPREVGRTFLCTSNNLTSLEGAPDRVGGKFFLDTHTFKWTPEGKIKFIGEHPKYGELIIPTLPYEEVLKMVSEDPTLLETIEEADKSLYDKVLKGLGWDKMGPDMLRQLKDGIY